jgi:hypothetical protein
MGDASTVKPNPRPRWSAAGLFRRPGCVAALLWLGGAACEPETQGEARISAEVVRDTSGATVTDLSIAPALVPSATSRIPTLVPDLVLGAGDPGFGRVLDIAAAGDGRFAVLDNLNHEIVIFDAAGQQIARWGRSGRGPGEFEFPVALTWLETGNLVVWNVSPTRTFTVLSPEGSVVAATGAPVEGDWNRLSFRWPRINRDGVQTGPEETAHRLQRGTGPYFLHLIQQNEVPLALADPSETTFTTRAAVIRYWEDFAVFDTLADLPAARYVRRRDLEIAGMLPTFEHELFAARPLFATGTGWAAIGHGDSPAVRIFRQGERHPSVVRWPAAAVAVADEDRITAAWWIVRFRIMNSPVSRSLFEQDSRRQQRAGIRGTAEQTPFADRAPQVSALYGFADCLLFAGFAPEDHYDGIAQTLLVVNVETGAVDGVIRIGAPGAVLKAFDRRAAYAVRRDGDGVFLVERYTLPPFPCSADPAQKP